MGTVRRDAQGIVDSFGPKLCVTAVVVCALLGAAIGMAKEASHSYRRAYGSTVQPAPNPTKG